MYTFRASCRCLLFAIGVFGMGAALPAVATAVSCGDTITVNTTLDSSDSITQAACDPNEPLHNPALTVQGSVTLDLGGFTIDCGDMTSGGGRTPEGIVLQNGAKLRNGVVTQCRKGVRLQSGSSEVTGVWVKGNDTGMEIQQAGNTVTDCTAEGSFFWGFAFGNGSSGNKLVGNTAIDNGGAGFDGGGVGDSNKFQQNVAINNGREGFLVVSANNKFQNNVAIGNGSAGSFDGFNVTGDQNSFREDVAHANSRSGFNSVGVKVKLVKVVATLNQSHNIAFSGTTSGKIIKSTAAGSATAAGISLICVDCTILKSRSVLNFGSGIGIINGNTNTKVIRNVAQGNGTDLVDGNMDCDSNTWKKNIFVTSSAPGVPCIQ